jgi:hypothetical protein
VIARLQAHPDAEHQVVAVIVELIPQLSTQINVSRLRRRGVERRRQSDSRRQRHDLHDCPVRVVSDPAIILPWKRGRRYRSARLPRSLKFD